jgi:hypothetical protein
VPGEFFSHFESKDRFFDGMVQDMETDKAGVKIPVLKRGIIIVFRYRHSIPPAVYLASESRVNYTAAIC